MKKSDRISAFVQELGAGPDLALDPRYLGYFTCFNTQRYYEAHDVLEDLWLRTNDGNFRFFKGLIQLAGAFVHLKRQYEYPTHPKHGRRLRPAVRLFHLALANLEPFGAEHLHLDLASVRQLCHAQTGEIIAGAYALNPWNPERAPELHLRVE